VRLSIGVEADGCSGTFSAAHAGGAGAYPAHRHFAGRWILRGVHIYAGVTCPFKRRRSKHFLQHIIRQLTIFIIETLGSSGQNLREEFRSTTTQYHK
jgi:hypothetical protein